MTGWWDTGRDLQKFSSRDKEAKDALLMNIANGGQTAEAERDMLRIIRDR
ncbi:MAG: hypothetical protein ACLU4N_15925 [Butyricimonas faecihominis]